MLSHILSAVLSLPCSSLLSTRDTMPPTGLRRYFEAVTTSRLNPLTDANESSEGKSWKQKM